MKNRVLELFGMCTRSEHATDWRAAVKDFVGIELQTLDSTGTVWPERQRLLKEHGTAGIATCLGLQVSTKVELEEIVSRLESQISDETLLSI